MVKNISEKIKSMLLKQLGLELYNHNLYIKFSNYFDIHGLTKLAEYYKLRADEEKEHHDWIYNYLSDIDVSITYPQIDSIENNLDSFIEPFEVTVIAEEATSKHIFEIVAEAQNSNDWFTFNVLMGKSKRYGNLVSEQLEEETLSNTVLDIAKMEATWLKKEETILKVYKNGH